MVYFNNFPNDCYILCGGYKNDEDPLLIKIIFGGEGVLFVSRRIPFSFILFSRYSLNRAYKIRSISKEIKGMGSFIHYKGQ